MVERLSERDLAQRDFAIKEIAVEVKGATSSMTSVPKPLKFLSVHYKRFLEIYELQADGEFKVSNFLSMVNILLTKFYRLISQTSAQLSVWWHLKMINLMHLSFVCSGQKRTL